MAETGKVIVRDAIDFEALELLKTDPEAYFSATRRPIPSAFREVRPHEKD